MLRRDSALPSWGEYCGGRRSEELEAGYSDAARGALILPRHLDIYIFDFLNLDLKIS